MRALFPRTREREVAWKLGAVIMGGSVVLTPLMMVIFERNLTTWYFSTVSHVMLSTATTGRASRLTVTYKQWTYIFSQILESVCVLPQLLLLRQTTVPTVISSFYILFLGSYRGLYILNWIWRGLDSNDRPPNAVSVIFGIIQTAFYVDFAWVYWTRQRVKLRDGAVVDADDLRRGWLLQRVFGKHIDAVAPEDEESRAGLGVGGNNRRAAGGARSKWGARGISVSADDGVLANEEHHGMLDESDDEEHGVTGIDPDAKMQDPDELARALEEDEEDNAPPRAGSSGQPTGVRGGDEWDD